MLEKILGALKARQGIQDWTIRQVANAGVQRYVLPHGVEAVRSVARECFVVDVMRSNPGTDGERTCGLGNATILPGDDFQEAIEQAYGRAALVHNPPYGVPEPAEIPEVPLVDEGLRQDPSGTLRRLEGDLRESVASYEKVQLASAEFFADIVSTRLVNSRGIEAEQEATTVYVEWVMTAEADGRRVESFADLTRRRGEDLQIHQEAERRAGYVADLLIADAPQVYRGPVVVRGSTLASMMTSRVLQMLTSAEAKYKQFSPWDVGQPIFGDEAHEGHFTMWANRKLPYGTNSNRFDREGIPADRVLIIEDGVLKAFTASQRFAEYLELPATGVFGNVELAPGDTATEELLDPPHVEIASFSWFFPDILRGEFASEVRLGYVVDGHGHRPFRGGMLVGNLLKALANAKWSTETGFYGDYFGPIAVRFQDLTLTEG
jgi:predicted Zn-dependent protease